MRSCRGTLLAGSVIHLRSVRCLLAVSAAFLVATSEMYAAYSAPSVGGVNYSLHASSLADAAAWLLTFMQYVVYILYAGASLLSLYSATVIYIKMNAGEPGIMKSILVLIGALLFLMASTVVLPGFFGIQHRSSTSWGW